MELYNADLHLHGLFSGAVSSDMLPRRLAEEGKLKGLQIIGTGDILHPLWEKKFKEETEQVGDELFSYKGITFILQTEVEDANRIHHVVLFPSLAQVQDARKKLLRFSSLDADGRPKIKLSTKEVAELFLDLDCLIGPSHAFTPYTGFYSKYSSLKEGYGDLYKKIQFIELGLSADTNMADRISELHNVSFLSNSDAHSPWPHRLGREFNTFLIEAPTFEEIKKAIMRKGNRKIIRNVGLDPREGKYHKTRCRNCYTFFEPEDALKLNWRCPLCNGIIKKGVDHRINELADLPKGKHPEHRPKYIHIIPLAEIISLALNISNVQSKNVQEIWRKIINVSNTEITALLELPIEEIEKINKKVAKYVDYFRKEKINYIPGGAGMYGKLIPPGGKVEIKIYSKVNQKKLSDFY